MTDNNDATLRTLRVAENVANDRTIVIQQPETMGQGGVAVDFHTTRNKPMEKPKDDAQNMAEDGAFFNLKGVLYSQIRCMSSNSGEAQIFLVEREGKEYVLKVYYPNFDVNRTLMQTIKSFQFEMIVKLYDYGKTYVDGKHRFYELMEYLRGGTMQDYCVNGDFNSFRHIALQAAAALAYCHQNNILHKDIKPSNFFFRDEEHKQVVLGDFGISSLLENDGKSFRTTQARTPIYAAPEMYSDVIDGEVEITPAADFYSLGITLFAIWLGENPLSSNERTMMHQKNEGRLPRLEELPEKVKKIVQGLTVVNTQKRWKYDEVERWFLGEDVPVDMSSPFLRYKSFIVDPDRNLVADNVHELIPLLLDNERLAINYIYNGRIASWLEASGNTKLSTVVKDVVTNRYPVDKKAGLMTAVYLMEPTYPYYDLQNEACDDVHAIAISLLSYRERYFVVLQNPNDPLFLWLETHTNMDVGRLRSYFVADAQPHVAVMRMVYEIDPDVPFLSNHASSTIKEIVRSFGYVEPTEDDWHSLLDGRLLSWMYSHEDEMACESLRILSKGNPYSQALAYKVLYNMDRTAAYDLREADTQERLGEYLAHRLQQLQHINAEDFAHDMEDITDPTGRFYYYAQLHGWYQEIAEANHCFDLNSTENRNRLGAYDLRTAAYRFCRILGVTPNYLLPDGTTLTDARQIVVGEQKAIMRSEMRNGSMAQWMSVFYHEDPNRDFSEEYSYEHELEKWIMALGDIDNQQFFYRRFVKAREDTAARVAEVKHDWMVSRVREGAWRYLYYILAALWLLLVIIVGINERAYMMEHPYLTILLPLGGMSGIIVAVRSFFHGFGPTLSFLFGLAGMASAYLPIWLLNYIDEAHPGLFNMVIVAMTIVYMTICHFTDFRSHDKEINKLTKEVLASEDINSSLLEPLYYTFKTKSSRYKASKFGLLDDVNNQLRSSSGETVAHYVLWSILMGVLILEFVLFSPKLLNLNTSVVPVKEHVDYVMDKLQNETDK
jgi:serine/threonine protein kinase